MPRLSGALRAGPYAALALALASCWSCASERAPGATAGAGGAASGPDAGGGGGGQLFVSVTSPTASTVASSTSTAPTTSTGVATPCKNGQTAPLHPDVPPCWERVPSMPDDCDVFYAPSPEYFNAPSPWAPCGEGCLELVNDWSPSPGHALFGASASAAGEGVRYLSYKRQIVTTTELHEMQIVRLPENRVEFNGIVAGLSAERCFGGVYAAGPTNHLMVLTHRIGEGWETWDETSFVIPAGQAVPRRSFHGPEEGGFLFATISSDLWAVVYQGLAKVKWHGLDFAPDMSPLYQTGKYAYAPASHGSDVFFSLAVGHVLAFDPKGGVRPLVDFPTQADGGACCLATDGKNMVWFQAANYLGNQTYGTLDLMTAPYATHAKDLQPRVLRSAFQNTVYDGGNMMSGNHAAALEFTFSPPETKLIVTRISDGAYWVIPHRPQFHWVQLLYVDDEEVAMVETPADGQAKLIEKPYHYTIVRRSLASLGPPKMPGDGF